MWIFNRDLGEYKGFDNFISDFSYYLADGTRDRLLKGTFEPEKCFRETFDYVFNGSPWHFHESDLDFFHQVDLETCISIIREASSAELPGNNDSRSIWWNEVDSGYDIARIACWVVFPKVIRWDDNITPEDIGYDEDALVGVA